ncbi:MAG TPA: GlsB/YeaQ/YmgE family stress response membrane protein [Gemmatimonadaceae bacterium]|nr:MAG: hypothetical protein ABS52_06625 [Gemmatimonadetes bacterium SCN 70-22]HMN08973.1 GlsB/YeaQ/YmgE family stress response membrane protein [Gemmatimonadaceae bacterium]
MGLIYTLIIGLVVGFIARALYKGDDSMGLLKTMVLGIAGAFLAGFLGRLVGWYSPGEGAGLIASVLGAMVVLWIAKRVGAKA